MSSDPEWLKRARAEGRILKETTMPQFQPPPQTVEQCTVAKPKKKKQKRAEQPSHWAILLYPGCHVVSEANRREHWGVLASRKAKQKKAVADSWAELPSWGVISWPYPVTVTFTFFHRKNHPMDGDNLQGAFKYIRDEVARCVLYSEDAQDNDPRITWKYAQREGKPGCEIRIEPRASKQEGTK